MRERLLTGEEAVRLLDLGGEAELDGLVACGRLLLSGGAAPGFSVSELIICRLAQVIEHVGVEPEKARTYAEAVLVPRLEENDENVFDWVDNETQELFCLIADKELARIFLKSQHDAKEIDVGAVKPMLFPVTQCQVNVFRAIRPVLLRARRLLKLDVAQ